MSNFLNRLVLFPMITIEEDIESISVQLLKKKGLISQQWMHNDELYYLAGHKFSSLLIFCGCAPRIQFIPEDNEDLGNNFVAVKFFSFPKSRYFYPGKQPFNYSCPRCNNSIRLSNKNEIDSMGDQVSFSCSHCSQEHFYQQINWRRKAGFSNFFIEVRGVFESETIPSDELLNILAALTNSKWGYFYADETVN